VSAELLSIVVPAYNEEESVQAILRRCLAAGRGLVESGAASEVEVILVDDGSRDATNRLAREVPGARVVAHPANRGYGAALKTGFEAARGVWLGFLDADGTCDPEFFRELLALARRERLDVALGSRMHEGSRMPPVRRLGNWLFRTLVRFVSKRSVSDVASGMRVLRRESLERLYPLPDGLHFTPAMSVRALLDPGLRIGEIPMPYEERTGRSKLHVLRDGLRFLRAIVETALTYRPGFFFSLLASVLAAGAALLLLLRLGGPEAPVPFYLAEGRLEDWMIFRLLLVSVLLASSAFLAVLGRICESLVRVVNRDLIGEPAGPKWLELLPVAGAASWAAALAINARPLGSYLRTGTISGELWALPVAGAAFALIGVQLSAFWAVHRIAWLLAERERVRARAGAAERQMLS